MKRILFCSLLVAAGLVVFGCSDDQPLQVGSSTTIDDDAAKCPPGTVALKPGEYYSMFANETGYGDFSRISRHNGQASQLWVLDCPLEMGGDDVTWWQGWFTFGFAFDVDGTMYSTFNMISTDPGLVRSQFGRIDSATGVATLYGPIMEFNTAGGDIDACGNFYVCGFQVNHLGYIWGNDSLWRVDKETGEFTEIGPTGHTNWMDLAFDRNGVLWGTFDNQLYVIDTETGASTLVTDITGVPDAGPPNMMEVMSIAFDKHNVLYGTGLTVYFNHPDGSPVMRIDTGTGAATLLGYSHTQWANHGGDILPEQVRIAHRKANGTFECRTISLNALPAHLAHGDYVPGTVGHDCDWP